MTILMKRVHSQNKAAQFYIIIFRIVNTLSVGPVVLTITYEPVRQWTLIIRNTENTSIFMMLREMEI